MPIRSATNICKRLIEACHRHGVLIYAWIELPHVSEKFWNDHPEWREKTALLQDAQLDWRKLMNLQNRDCATAIRAGLRRMIERFDWDGVNLAELYFESLEGAGNPARFTPMNDDVRAEFRAQSGWDPIEIWRHTQRCRVASPVSRFSCRARPPACRKTGSAQSNLPRSFGPISTSS